MANEYYFETTCNFVGSSLWKEGTITYFKWATNGDIFFGNSDHARYIHRNDVTEYSVELHELLNNAIDNYSCDAGGIISEIIQFHRPESYSTSSVKFGHYDISKDGISRVGCKIVTVYENIIALWVYSSKTVFYIWDWLNVDFKSDILGGIKHSGDYNLLRLKKQLTNG